MRVAFILIAIAATVANLSTAQDYQDYADGYEQDNLYQDYAAKQQGKEVGGGWAHQIVFSCDMTNPFPDCLQLILSIHFIASPMNAHYAL